MAQLLTVGNEIFAATAFGLFGSSDYGMTFSPIALSQPYSVANESVSVLPFNGLSGLMYVSTDGSNRIAPVKAYAALTNSLVASAVSTGSRVVAGIFGDKSEVVVFDDGQKTSSLPPAPGLARFSNGAVNVIVNVMVNEMLS